MLNGTTPWTGKDLTDLRNNICTKQINFKENTHNPEIIKLIQAMLRLESK